MSQNGNSKSLWTDGVLLDVDVSYWRHQAKLQPADLGLKAGEVPQIFVLGRKQLIDSADMRDFALIESRARTLVMRYSFPFILSTVRFVPYTVLEEVVTELKKLQGIMDVLADSFVAEYIQKRDAFMEKYSLYKDALAPHYPMPAELRYKFSLTWTLFEVRLPSELTVELRTEEEASNKAKIIQQARAEMQGQIDKFIGQTANILRSETATICKRILDNFNQSGQLKDVTLQSLADFIDRWRKMNFIGDTEVESMLASLESSIPWGAGNTPAFANSFRDVLQATYASMVNSSSNASVVTIASNYSRKIIF